MEKVRELYERGIANGVKVKLLDGDEARKAEPSLSPDVIGALWTNESAIINPWEFATAMAEVAVVNGAVLMLENEVTGIEKNDGYLTVNTDRGSYSASYVINAAGAHSPDICAMVGDTRLKAMPRSGQYYVLDKEEGAKVGSVIFGCPDENGFKGILVAPTVHGNLLVGPTSDPTDDPEDLSTDPAVLSRIKAAGLKMVPGIDYRNVIRQYTGIRPTTNVRDFVIDINPCCDRMIDLASIASPGLSAATAIGEEAVKLLKKAGLELKPNEFFRNSRPPVTRMKDLNRIRRRAIIKKDPAYGRDRLPLRDCDRGRDRRGDPPPDPAEIDRRRQTPRRRRPRPLPGRLLLAESASDTLTRAWYPDGEHLPRQAGLIHHHRQDQKLRTEF